MGTISSVHAQVAPPKLYAEIGYAQFDYSERDADPILPSTVKLSPRAATGTFGYRFMPNLAAEGFMGIGLGTGTMKVTLDGEDVPNDIKSKVKYALGVFVKPSIAVHERVELFARLGWVRQKLEVSSATESDSASSAGVAYGVGANFNLTSRSYIQASWMTYFKDNKPIKRKSDGFAMAYGLRF
ncbi:MAG: outer membrane beta-barrel protein [Hydrogenophaga sp.]|nr:outer membrane beta-barrel protein [Hydrogenophaga sp.]MDO9435630.1 outer membrane beta-barrel protein [Hydrogenophaga sp.]